MTVDRILPTDEAYDLLGLTKEIAEGELAPRASAYEERGEFPRDAVRVHTLACFPVAAHGSEQQRKMLPEMLGGELLGAYCLSEPQGGSDAAALTTKATRDGDRYVVTGTKAWITHAGQADFYNVFCRTGGPGPSGISCLLADAGTPG